MPKLSRRQALALPLAGVLARPALAQAQQAPGVTDTEILVGQTMPYSGPAVSYAVIGKSEAAYFQMINDQGGVNGRKIKFLSLDDGYVPPKTVEQTRRLVEQEQVAFMFGSLGTPTNNATRKYLNDKKVPTLFVATGADAVRRLPEIPLDHGLAAHLPDRGPRLCQIHPGDEAERQGRRALSERRLRQGLPQGLEGRAGRGQRRACWSPPPATRSPTRPSIRRSCRCRTAARTRCS